MHFGDDTSAADFMTLESGAAEPVTGPSSSFVDSLTSLFSPGNLKSAAGTLLSMTGSKPAAATGPRVGAGAGIGGLDQNKLLLIGGGLLAIMLLKRR